jgi:microcystin-dependent protein
MSDPYIGEIRLFGGNFAPAGWAFCSGQLLPISEYDILFNLIGTTYGGDGQETFALPNLQSRVPVHMGTNSSTGTSYQIAEAAGTESVTLTVQQIPQHTHPAAAVTGLGDRGTPAASYWGGSLSSQYSSVTPAAAMNAQNVAPAGGSQPHENMLPFLTVNFIISLFGTFPSQT